MSTCQNLHEIVRRGRRFNFPFDEDLICSNGIYVLFEKGESGHNGKRIVRIGYNLEQGNLFPTINRHVYGNINTSIFRRYIRECLTENNRNNNQIKNHIVEHFTFVIIRVDDKRCRSELRKKLIATVATCRLCEPSRNWFGLNSPEERIQNSGLWQVQNLNGQQLTPADLEYIKNHLVEPTESENLTI